MDEIDIRICGLLIQNARLSYREMADILGMSLQAVHKRMQQLQQTGVVAGFHTFLSISYLDAVVVHIMGSSSLVSMDDVAQALSKNDRTFVVVVSDRNYLTIGALLKRIQDLDAYVSFVRETAGIKEPTVGIESIQRISDRRFNEVMEGKPELNRLDYRIISSLSRDARKPIEEVALEIKASSATVKRRLDRMMDLKLINMALEWHPSNSEMLVPQFHLRLRPGTDKVRLAGELMNRTGGRMLFFAAFGNLPDFVYCVVWGRTSREVAEIADQARKVEGVESLMVNNVIREYEFETWRDKLVRERAAARMDER